MLCLAVVLSIAALAASGGNDATTAIAEGSAHVSLTEFAIAPATVTVAAGGTVHATNDGAAAHNLSVTGTELTNPRPGGRGGRRA